MPQFEDVAQDYTDKWATLEIHQDKLPFINRAVNKIINGKAKYQSLEISTGVPWWFIGLLHLRESGCNFSRHLHNGDPLTSRTTHEPPNRPPTHRGPFTFEESAVDALKYMGYTSITDWGVERVAFCFEKYNGFGYRNKNIASPYLWAASTHYVKGKYVRDRVFNANAVDTQLGAMCVLKILLEHENIDLTPIEEVQEVANVPLSPSADADRPTTGEMRLNSRKFALTEYTKYFSGGFGSIMLFLSQIGTFVKDNATVIIIALCVLICVGMYLFQKYMKDDVQDDRYTPSGGTK